LLPSRFPKVDRPYSFIATDQVKNTNPLPLNLPPSSTHGPLVIGRPFGGLVDKVPINIDYFFSFPWFIHGFFFRFSLILALRVRPMASIKMVIRFSLGMLNIC